MGQVGYLRTIVSAADALGAVQAAMPSSDANAAIMVAAQSAFETAGWQWMANYNMGNITTGNPNADDWMYQPGNSLKFKAYSSLEAGAQDMVSFLTKRAILPYAYANDLTGYVNRLQATNYAGSDPNVYVTYKTGMANWIAKLGGVTPNPPVSFLRVALVSAAAGGAGYLLARYWGLL